MNCKNEIKIIYHNSKLEYKNKSKIMILDEDFLMLNIVINSILDHSRKLIYFNIVGAFLNHQSL